MAGGRANVCHIDAVAPSLRHTWSSHHVLPSSTMRNMKAIVVSSIGDPSVLTPTDFLDPTLRDNELLIDVEAAGINYKDVYERIGRPPYNSTPPFIPGSEGAGTVVAVGPAAQEFAVGDTVAWASVPGSYAEQVSAAWDKVVKVPTGVSLQDAAAVMLQGMTAHYLCSDTYRISRGDIVVVHAGAGGVGLLLIQMAKRRGACVIATTSTAKKGALATEAGADYATAYEDFPAAVEEASHGAGAQVIYDGVGQSTFDAGLACLAARGMMVLYGAASGPVPTVETAALSSRSLFLTRPVLYHYIATREELTRRAQALFPQIADGSLSVHIGATYHLSDAAQAHRDLEARLTTGKLLLLPHETAAPTSAPTR